jgi:lysophospholipase L1-like esterase
MLAGAWDGLLWVVALGFPWLLSRRRSGASLAAFVALANLLFACSFLLIVPAAEPSEAMIAAVALLALDLAAWFAPDSLQRRLLILVRWPSAKILMTVATAGLIPLGLVELACRILTGIHVLDYHRPIETVWRPGADDWRLATITGDENREPDPVLLWRPVARKPFTAQRFKGPLVQVPKPPGVVRVICYGDSLTDGPFRGGWPPWIEVLLNRRPPRPGLRCEVLNAGVAGYSSYQGLLRFLQEIDRYQPDLVLVSFGWNDAAPAIGQPDKSFRIPPWPGVLCQRALVRYRAYLVLMYYTRCWRARPPATPSGCVQPRVSLEDYLANLERFRAEAEARDIPILFLTRPHKLAPPVLSRDPTWRASVPRYNAALRAWAARRDVPLIDAQHLFAELPASLFTDECHFTPEGYQRMGELVYSSLADGPRRMIRLAVERPGPGSARWRDPAGGEVPAFAGRGTTAPRR